MARVLFIESNLRNEKLGIMYISAVLKKNGHETLLCWYERENIDDVIKSFAPDYLAFSLATGDHKQLIEIAIQLKGRYKINVIFGGPHATFFYEKIPKRAADFIIVGQGEKAIIDIVENKTNKMILMYDFMDLDLIPFPDRSLFYRFKEFNNNPMKNIITLRDCPYACSYCYNHSWKKMFKGQSHFMQRRSVDNVLEETKELKRNYFLNKILFIDDNFLIGEKWIEEFCEKYKKEIDLPFLCSFKVNLLNEHKLKMLREAGLFMVNFALETADPVVQKDILNRGDIKNEHVIAAIELFKKYGIKSRMQNMIGLPLKESLKDALNTLRFNKEYHVDDSWVSIFQPYPNTRLAEYTVQNGFIEGSLEESIAKSFFDESLLKINDREKINRLQKWWFFVVKYNFSAELISIILKIDFDDTVGQDFQRLRYEFSKKYLYDIEDNNNYLFDCDWENIFKRFHGLINFNVWGKIIKKYGLCIGLSEILMKLKISEEIKNEISKISLSKL